LQLELKLNFISSAQSFSRLFLNFLRRGWPFLSSSSPSFAFSSPVTNLANILISDYHIGNCCCILLLSKRVHTFGQTFGFPRCCIASLYPVHWSTVNSIRTFGAPGYQLWVILRDTCNGHFMNICCWFGGSVFHTILWTATCMFL